MQIVMLENYYRHFPNVLKLLCLSRAEKKLVKRKVYVCIYQFLILELDKILLGYACFLS